MTFDNLITREKTRMPSINQKGRETEHMVLPDDAKFVTVDEAAEYGYHGITPDTSPRSEHTFAGQAAKLAASSKPTSSAAPTKSPRGADK